MTHLSPDELTLHYYDEGRDGAAEHLSACEGCRAEYRELQRVLNAAAGYVPPERQPGYESDLWRRIQRELPARAAKTRGWWSWKPALGAGILCAALGGAFYAGRVSAPVEVRARPDALLLNALEQHVDRSQLVLTEVANGSAPPAGELEDLLGANRLYRQTAEMSGEAGLADVLDDLEMVLLEAGHAPPGASHEPQRRLETDGMLFKLRVLGEELRRKSEVDIAEESL